MGHLLVLRPTTLLFAARETAKNSFRVRAVLDKRKALIDGNDFLEIVHADRIRKNTGIKILTWKFFFFLIIKTTCDLYIILYNLHFIHYSFYSLFFTFFLRSFMFLIFNILKLISMCIFSEKIFFYFICKNYILIMYKYD